MVQKVVLINSIVAENDAISSSVIDMASILTEAGLQVSIFCHSCDYRDLPVILVDNSIELIFHESYLSAELIIWHFGIYYELFNAALIGNGSATQVVCFHNVTPSEYVPASKSAVIRRSLDQMHLMLEVDEVWSVSPLNKITAESIGVPADRIQIVPLQVDNPEKKRLDQKPIDIIKLLYVGRFVEAKGVHDLLKVMLEIKKQQRYRFHLSLVGNEMFSDKEYYRALQEWCIKHELNDIVTFVGTVTDCDLWKFLHQAHILAIPSYHEGFCKPVVEALRAGCIPIGYSSYNLPNIVSGYGRLVEPGNLEALREAFESIISALPLALNEPMEAHLNLDCGSMSVFNFSSAASSYTEQFTRSTVTRQIMERITLMSSGAFEGRRAE